MRRSSLRRADLHALDVGRHYDLLGVECHVPGSCTKEKQYCTSFISAAAYLRYQASIASMPPLALADHERQVAGSDDRETAGLIARIDVGEIGDAVARHVVMVECLAELLRRIDLVLDGSARVFLDVVAPFLDRLLQRMRRRHQCDSLSSKVLSCADAVPRPRKYPSKSRARRGRRLDGLVRCMKSPRWSSCSAYFSYNPNFPFNRRKGPLYKHFQTQSIKLSSSKRQLSHADFNPSPAMAHVLTRLQRPPGYGVLEQKAGRERASAASGVQGRQNVWSGCGVGLGRIVFVVWPVLSRHRDRSVRGCDRGGFISRTLRGAAMPDRGDKSKQAKSTPTEAPSEDRKKKAHDRSSADGRGTGKRGDASGGKARQTLDPRRRRSSRPRRAAEPFGLRRRTALPAARLLTKWSGVEADIRAESEILARCRRTAPSTVRRRRRTSSPSSRRAARKPAAPASA